MPDVSDYAAFIRANTSFLRPSLVPAIALHLADFGDPFRTYLSLGELDLLTTYHVPVSRDLEDREIRRTSVFRLRTGEIASGADS